MLPRNVGDLCRPVRDGSGLVINQAEEACVSLREKRT